LAAVTESRSKGELTQRSLGISAPEGKDVCEPYAKVKTKSIGMAGLVELLGTQAEILGVHANVSREEGVTHIILYLEMADAKFTVDEAVNMFRKQHFVISAWAPSKRMMHFESMLFPLVRGTSYRVFVLGADEWVHLLEAFGKKFGSAGAAVLHEQGVSVGEIMAARLEDRFKSKPTPSVLQEDFVGLIQASGMGRLKISGTRFGFIVKIEDPTVSEVRRGLIDNFLVGVVAGAL